jgi:hypothetical protein
MLQGPTTFFQLAAFFGGAVVILLKVWHGWRLGPVRQSLSLFALVVCLFISYSFGGYFGSFLVPLSDLPEAILIPIAGVVLGGVIYGVMVFAGAIVFKKTGEQTVGLVRLGYGLSGGVVGAIYGLIFWGLILLCLRFFGTLAEVEVALAKNHRFNLGLPLATKISPLPVSHWVENLAQIKEEMEGGFLGSLVHSFDPMPENFYSNAHNLSLMIANEQSVRRFFTYPGLKALLASPKVVAIQSDPEVVKAIVDHRYFEFLSRPAVIDLRKDSEFARLWSKFDFGKALDYANQGKMEEKP